MLTHQALAENRGMRYFHLPVDFASPSREDFERFARIMRDQGAKRVFVHCELDLSASSFVFLYRVAEFGEDPDRAYRDVTRVWEPNPRWRHFMREILAARGARPPMELD